MARSFSRWNTLRTRITLGVLILFVSAIWLLSFIASDYLRTDIRRLSSDQQAATAQMVANQINRELVERIDALQSVAQAVVGPMQAGVSAVDSFLNSRYDLHALFNSRVYIVQQDGIAIAAWPTDSGPTGLDYSERDYIATALKHGKASVGRPDIGPTSHKPTISFAAPIKDQNGQVIGAIAGTINLTLPNFLDPIMSSRHGQTGDLTLVAPQQRLLITGTKKSSVFRSLPGPGEDPLVDHFVSGAEGEAVSRVKNEVDRLVAVRNIPVAGWQLAASLAVTEVDVPIRDLQTHIFGATILLTVLAGCLTWWMLRRQLMPLQATARKLATLADESVPLEPLPVVNDDEIGQLLKGFNRLINILGEREALIRSVLDTTDVAIFLLDTDGNITLANRAMAEMFCISEADLLGRRYSSLVPPAERDAVRQRHLPLLAHSALSLDLDRIYNRADASPFWGHLTIRPFRDPSGNESRMIGVIADIDVRKKAEQALQKSIEQYDKMAAQLPIGVYILRNSAANVFTADYVSPRTAELFGLDAELLRSTPEAVYQVVHPEERDRFIKIHQEARARHTPINWQGRVLSGSAIRWLHVTSIPDPQGNGDVLWHGLVEDVTEREVYERQLEQAAHYDALTALPNRVLLGDRLAQAMRQGKRRGKKVAVAYLDIDEFKEINDQHGHTVGDQVLIAMAGRMRLSMREGDTLARLGGDEFVVVMLDVDENEASFNLLGRMLTAVSEPIRAGAVSVQVSCSIGVTFYPQEDEVDGDQLLRQADLAMYQAKVAGKNRYCIFDAEQDRDMRGQHQLQEDIRRAIGQNEFVLHYQPKVNMKTGKVVGAEALIRWRHPDKGLLFPIAFLPMIENQPISLEIGEWVIDSALRQMEQWHAQGLDLPVSVNIGAFQLQQSGFVERLRQQLAAHPVVAPRDLTLEVLETSALEDLNQVSEVIGACQDLGVKLALDDFGTGYSSLTYLKRLTVNQLKIDQSFVRDMLDDPEDLTILEGVIGLADAFRREVIAEGVESDAHGEMLLLMGCELAQGYGIARPMPADEIMEWSRTWRPNPLWASLSPVSREDRLPLFATTEHRAWVLAMERYVKGLQTDVPPQNIHLCRFGMWLDTEGKVRHSNTPAFGEISALHFRCHVIASDLCELVRQDRRGEAIAKLNELRDLRDTLLEAIKTLVQKQGA